MLDANLASSPHPASNPRSGWSPELQQAYELGRHSGVVGSILVSETERVRVWHLTIAPGAICGFHRHVLNYFWTVHTEGHARGYFEDGSIVDSVHTVGQTKHLSFAAGEYMVHAVENIGETELVFTTVEFLDSPNEPIDVPGHVRLS